VAYRLLVYFPGDRVPRATFDTQRAPEVLTIIPEILASHDGCEHVVVMLDGARLFAVDCHGNRLP
jgi:hypothetical protein